MDVNPNLPFHTHNGLDSPKIPGSGLENTPQATPTTENTTVLSTGGAAVLSTSDSGVIDNMRTRIGEIETILRNLGVII